jgi:hypothetical protein
MKPCHRPATTRRTLTRLAIDLDSLIAGVIEERSEEESKGLVPVVSGGYRYGGDNPIDNMPHPTSNGIASLGEDTGKRLEITTARRAGLRSPVVVGLLASAVC